MRYLLFFCSFFLFCGSVALGQAAIKTDFESFATDQNRLFVAAYQQKDTRAFHRLLDKFLARYNQLSESDKKKYTPYYTSALYNLSCIYALLNDKAKALDYLDRSIKSGYTNYTHIISDKDFASVRGKEFTQVVAPLRAVADYLYILKKPGQYNLQEQRAIPAFTYQPANTPHLEVLRKTFNLDSVAGSGNEISRILNLLHWVHNTVPHDGQHESGIKHINAADIIGTAHLKKIGVSCGELTTALNECYLAIGWKARKVYCFPKDSLGVDRDSHVINMVYATTHKKWIWADPTNDAYVMNEKGELLGLEEVRQRLIRDEPLLLNPDANWNRKASTTKEAYLYTYMAKNLYRFACTLGSEYDMETPGTGKTITYVHLLPLDFSRQSPERSESHNKELGTTVINYKTNNPALFWQVPVL